MSKFSVVRAALELKDPMFLWFVVLMLIATVIEAGYFFRIIQNMFFKQGNNIEGVKEAPLSCLVPIGILAVLIVVIGVYPQLVSGMLKAAAQGLVERAAYIQYVLGVP